MNGDNRMKMQCQNQPERERIKQGQTLRRNVFRCNLSQTHYRCQTQMPTRKWIKKEKQTRERKKETEPSAVAIPISTWHNIGQEFLGTTD